MLQVVDMHCVDSLAAQLGQFEKLKNEKLKQEHYKYWLEEFLCSLFIA